jgi:hypothetical protein
VSDDAELLGVLGPGRERDRRALGGVLAQRKAQVGIDRHAGEALRDGRVHGYIRKTPKRVGGTGAESATASARPNASRVWAGSRIPSSHRRAVE